MFWTAALAVLGGCLDRAEVGRLVRPTAWLRPPTVIGLGLLSLILSWALHAITSCQSVKVQLDAHCLSDLQMYAGCPSMIAHAQSYHQTQQGASMSMMCAQAAVQLSCACGNEWHAHSMQANRYVRHSRPGRYTLRRHRAALLRVTWEVSATEVHQQQALPCGGP